MKLALPSRLIALTPVQYASRRNLTPTAHAFGRGTRVAPHRADYEFYPTPPEATRALLSAETFAGRVWEPACGRGHISKVLTASGYDVVSTDLATCWGFGDGARDFLAEKSTLAPNIVTNPPYGRGLADAFITHALNLTHDTGGSVAMLLAIQSLAHPSRHAFWTSKPPSVLYALDDCQCWPYGDPSRATTAIGRQRYVWAVWKPHTGPTLFKWLSTKPFKVP